MVSQSICDIYLPLFIYRKKVTFKKAVDPRKQGLERLKSHMLKC